MKRLGIERFPAFLLCVVMCCYAPFVMLIAVRLRIDLAYDGTDFYGWAKQPDMRTVQGEIERVLHTILRVPEGDDNDPLRLTVAGRTDTGVHASHQVCHLDINEETLARCVGHMQVEPVMALTRRLQRMLPNDIAIRSIKEAPEGFDARFSALERTYVYRIADRSSEIDPRIRNSVLHIDDNLDIDAMNKAAEMTIGLHDFGSFATPNPGGTTIREAKPRIGGAYRSIRLSATEPPWGSGIERPPWSRDCSASPSSPTRSLAIWCVRWLTVAYRSVSANVPWIGSPEKWRRRCVKAVLVRSLRKD